MRQHWHNIFSIQRLQKNIPTEMIVEKNTSKSHICQANIIGIMEVHFYDIPKRMKIKLYMENLNVAQTSQPFNE